MSDEPFITIASRSAPAKFVSATVAVDYGDADALVLAPGRARFTTFDIGSVTLINRSGGAAVVGLGVRLPRHRWGVGTVTAAGVFTDATPAGQDPTVDDLVLHNRANSGSGIIIHAETPFNVVSIVQGVAGDQTTPVLLLEYWDGTAWVNIAAAVYSGDTFNPGAVAEQLLCFAMPPGWVMGGSGTGVRQDRYNLRVRYTHSGAGAANPTAAQMFVGISVLLVPAVADGGVVTHTPGHSLIAHRWGDALFPIFGVSGIDNLVDLSYRFT